MGPALLPTPLSPACGPASRYLAPGVSPLATRRSARGYVARRSRRCRIVLVAGSGPKTCPLPPRNPRPWGCAALQCRSRFCQGATALAAATGFACRAFTMARAAGFNGLAFGLPLRVLPSAGPPPAAHRHRIVRVWSLQAGSAGDPSRRFRSRSTRGECAHAASRRKRARCDLSTFGAKASGQGWISQRLVAKARLGRPICGRAGRGGAGGVR